jgi:dCMP deaminase
VVFHGELRSDWADSEAAGKLIMAEAGVEWQYGVAEVAE